MRTPKLKAQPTNAFFATVNQMFSGSSQLPTTVEHCSVVWIVLKDLITTRSAVVGSWEEPPNIWLLVAKNAFVGWALNCTVRMLLKGAVTTIFANIWSWSVNVPDQRSKMYLQINRRMKCHLCKMAPLFIGCKCHLKLFLLLFPIF